MNADDLQFLRQRWQVPDTQTVAVGRTDIPGLEGVTFEAGSPRVRTEANLKPWAQDPLLYESDIQSPPNISSLGRNHAEGGVLAQLDLAIKRSGIDPSREGTVHVIQSNKAGVCTNCRAGLGGNPNVADGPIKQFSLKYPNITIIIETAGDPMGDLVVRNGIRLI